jgi:D-glycero-D-manno-heptose 1,7-bisphosphate phosphatase
LIENRPDYVRSWQDLVPLPGALESLVRLSALPLRIVIVTNQSAVGRGLLPLATAHEINHRLVDQVVAAGGRIDGVYLCPHLPGSGCACRKPAPGLILQAATELHLDLPSSVLIGDAVTDIQAGRAAGVGRLALVRTGLGSRLEAGSHLLGLPEVPIFRDLAQALSALFPTA